MIQKWLRPWLLHAIDDKRHYVVCYWCGLLAASPDVKPQGEFQPSWVHTPHSRATAAYAIREHRRCPPIVA